jgi:serine/threonine protein kinase, bacterial
MAGFDKRLARAFVLPSALIAIVGLSPHLAWSQIGAGLGAGPTAQSGSADQPHASAAIIQVGSVSVFNRTDNGAVAPKRVLTGPSTGLQGTQQGVPDATNNEQVVTNCDASTITVYPRTANGNVAPIRTIGGAATGLGCPVGAYVDVVNNEIGVANEAAGLATPSSILIFGRTANGNVAPLRTISGPATGLMNAVFFLALDSVNNEIFVSTCNLLATNTCAAGSQSIRVFSRTLGGNVPPLRVISGPATGLTFPQGVSVDLVNNEVVVTDLLNNSILVFSRTANGNFAPIRTISGAATGLSNPICVYVDAVNNEIGVTSFGNNTIAIFGRTQTGNVAPLRVITGIAQPLCLSPDPVNNEIFVTNNAAANTAAVPTLSEWAEIVMVALLVVGALWTLRRRSTGLRPA